MGDSYKPSAAGDATNNMYGMGWSHPNAGGLGGASNLNDHGLLIINNGTFRAAISSRIVASEEVRGTLFRDYNDTGYYVDPNSGTSLRTAGAWQSDHAGWTGELNKIQWHSSHLYFQNTSGGYLAIFRAAGGAEKMYIDSAGNVTASGNITAYSDRRLKENIVTIPNAISMVQRLRGVTFDWIADKKHSYGLIAQEVEEVIPELVLETESGTADGDDKKTVKSVDYSKMVSVLIEAIKEQQQQIEKQQSQIDELKSLVQSITHK